jgi:transketolase
MYRDRVYNIGICEQAMMSLAAGLAKEGLIPIVHSIAPFVAERCLEQIKIDLGYQRLAVNIVSVGGSYDYSALGCTHHCPADVGILSLVPGMEILVPGTGAEFDQLFRARYSAGHSAYYRLSERSNKDSQAVAFAKATVVRRGARGTVIAVGPLLDPVLEAAQQADVTVLYYTTLAPFDENSIREHSDHGKVLIVEPFYEGTLSSFVSKALDGRRVEVSSLGVPRIFLSEYGNAATQDEACGLTAPQIRRRLEAFLDE